jgi:hypothetical protein
MYEHRAAPVLPRRQFVRRLALHALVAAGVVALSLGVGVVGYHYLARLSWVDAFLNAAMILGGMGPVDPLRSPAAKLFASFYALFSGVVFLATAAILMAPLVHRLLHRFHLDADNDGR